MKPLWPPSLEDITYFVSYLSLKGLASSTAKTYLAGVGYECKITGYEDVTNHFLIRKMLEGLSRSKSAKDTRAPITLDLLKKIIYTLPTICYSVYETHLFKAAFTLAFFGLMRVSELVIDDKRENTSPVNLVDVKMNILKNQIELTIPKSKTDQQGLGSRIIIMATCDDTCPFSCMNEYLKQRSKVNGPLFCHFSGRPLTRFQFSSVLLKALKCLHIDTMFYKTHSFRIGGATYYHNTGVGEEELKTKGRWKSKVYTKYIRN